MCVYVCLFACMFVDVRAIILRPYHVILCPYRSPVLIVEVVFSFPVLTDVVNQLQIDMAQLKESMDLYVSMTPAKTVETNVEQENCMILSGFTEDQVCLWLCMRPVLHCRKNGNSTSIMASQSKGLVVVHKDMPKSAKLQSSCTEIESWKLAALMIHPKSR